MIQNVSTEPSSSLADPNQNLAMRRVLHLKLVTQCAMLEDFGIFLVLADKVRFLVRYRASSYLSFAVPVCISY
jgi:hypothetical protein